MTTARTAPGRARTGHPDTCYGSRVARSSIPKKYGGEYTFEKARELVLVATAWLHERGWALLDTADLGTYGPNLTTIDRASLQRVIDDLVRTEDLAVTVHQPPFCRRPRPCYSLATNDRWAEEVDQ